MSSKLLWAHTRSIAIEAFKEKVVYSIPMYFDHERITRFESAIVQNGTLIITTIVENETPRHLLHKSGSQNRQELKVRVGNETVGGTYR